MKFNRDAKIVLYGLFLLAGAIAGAVTFAVVRWFDTVAR
jgi:hypothetical protein